MKTSNAKVWAAAGAAFLVTGIGAWAWAGQRAAAKKAEALPPAPAATQKQVSDWIETFVAAVRGREGLDIPAGLRARAKEISGVIASRWAAKKFPAVTKDDLETLYYIARAT